MKKRLKKKLDKKTVLADLKRQIENAENEGLRIPQEKPDKSKK